MAALNSVVPPAVDAPAPSHERQREHGRYGLAFSSSLRRLFSSRSYKWTREHMVVMTFGAQIQNGNVHGRRAEEVLIWEMLNLDIARPTTTTRLTRPGAFRRSAGTVRPSSSPSGSRNGLSEVRIFYVQRLLKEGLLFRMPSFNSSFCQCSDSLSPSASTGNYRVLYSEATLVSGKGVL